MSEQQNRDALERYFETFERQDPGAFVELLHDDYVEEFPQSGERIRGYKSPNFIEHLSLRFAPC